MAASAMPAQSCQDQWASGSRRPAGGGWLAVPAWRTIEKAHGTPVGRRTGRSYELRTAVHGRTFEVHVSAAPLAVKAMSSRNDPVTVSAPAGVAPSKLPAKE
jgi:hypothetical protein